MADSVDRVFVHALNTVKEIPKTGASRPPPSDQLRLYGLYKQAMEGDVDGVMEPPAPGPGLTTEELQREWDKWHAWNLQNGMSRTKAKRRYVEALIETMHRYATTSDATELVAELEFVWNQIRHNSPSSSDASPKARSGSPGTTRGFQQPLSGADGPMKVLSPMSKQGEAELRSQRQMELKDEADAERGRSSRWQRKMEHVMTKLSAEVAALREQITTGREWKSKKERSFPALVRLDSLAHHEVPRRRRGRRGRRAAVDAETQRRAAGGSGKGGAQDRPRVRQEGPPVEVTGDGATSRTSTRCPRARGATATTGPESRSRADTKGVYVRWHIPGIAAPRKQTAEPDLWFAGRFPWLGWIGWAAVRQEAFARRISEQADGEMLVLEDGRVPMTAWMELCIP